MEMTNLAHTNIEISSLALGTMTFGEQTNIEEAFRILDRAYESGINLLDSAEAYPIPMKKETQGSAEAIVGQWLTERNLRQRFILATKVAGPGLPHIREGSRKFVKADMEKALNDSLRRLKTDYIDIWQLHWPARLTNFFDHFPYSGVLEEDEVQLSETISYLEEFRQQGKIRYFGLSNETPWGLSKSIDLTKQTKSLVSIQNAYNLLNRLAEYGLYEMCSRENISYFGYSPLAMGLLTGKYGSLTRVDTTNFRLNLFPQFTRYTNKWGKKAIESYVGIARKYDISPLRLALAFVLKSKCTSTNIVGVTNLNQLDEILSSNVNDLNDDIQKEIDEVHKQHPNPCP